MKIDILDRTKKKKVLESLSYVGEIKTNNMLIRSGDRIRIFSGNLRNEEIMKLWGLFQIEGIGLYFAKVFTNKRDSREARVSIDALHMFKEQITNNIVELEPEQKIKWFKGENIELEPEQKEKYKENKGFVSLKYKGDFIGTGKISENGTLLNYLPKERRVRN